MRGGLQPYALGLLLREDARYDSLLTTCYLLPTTHYRLPPTCYLVLATCYLLLGEDARYDGDARRVVQV